MSELKHTPAPWTANKYGSVHCKESRPMAGGSGTNIFDADHPFGGTANPDDAPLVAAAPDLLAALIYYRDECSGSEPSISVFNRMADEAIAKATSPPPQEPA